MPSLSLLATTTAISSSSVWTSNNKSLVRYQPPVRVGKQVVKYTCCQKKQSGSHDKESNNGASNIDRRNMLFGLGGMYGAASSTIGTDLAMGAPFAPPDLTTCGPAYDPIAQKDLQCCPSKEFLSAKIVDFKPPYSYGDDLYHKQGPGMKRGGPGWKQGSGRKQGPGRNSKPSGSRWKQKPDFSWKNNTETKLRIRKPAHEFTPFEVQRFEAAIRAMKELDPEDPWNFYQQALIHCTYCNTAYPQSGSDKKLQVHGSWFFLPWHRMYLYFWERILGKLINDPTFTIPFWNWDNPKAMKIPRIYVDNRSSPLYDEKRNLGHYNLVWDYLFDSGGYQDLPPSEEEMVIERNMSVIRKTFDEAKLNPRMFMGEPLRAGEDAASIAISGSCERLHDPMHGWVGSLDKPAFPDMGNFATAAKDTLFWAHHGNIDRMWDLYNKGWNDGKLEFDDNDWLDSTFLFYDENRQVVRIKVRDVLTTEQLGYTYQYVDNPWVETPTRTTGTPDTVGVPTKVFEFGPNARAIEGNLRAIAKRPKVSRSDTEKENATEVLIINGIKFKDGVPGRLDVYVTRETSKGEVGPYKGELAGSFVNIPHGKSHLSSAHHGQKGRLNIGITVLIEDMDSEGAENLVVTLVSGNGGVTVDGIHIELVNNPRDQ